MIVGGDVFEKFFDEEVIKYFQEVVDCMQFMGWIFENVSVDFGVICEMMDKYVVESFQRVERV